MKDYDVIIIGAGAAGMMCGWQAAKRGRRVCLIDHMRKIGEKIRISGGGRCNFTNLYCTAENFISQNPHFCKSALSRFSPYDFMALLDERDIKYHEKPYTGEGPHDKAPLNSQGQMFCDESAGDIIDMLKKG
ncbi:MAG: FAD-dependent oxidoreductase, partial [Pseudomonadota bacterium]|nr:FAD-dependent oxidoreductase [Pseudomonadota bacterium]